MARIDGGDAERDRRQPVRGDGRRGGGRVVTDVVIPIAVPMVWLRDCSPNARPSEWRRRQARADLRLWVGFLLLEQTQKQIWAGRVPLREPVLRVRAIGPQIWDRDNLIASLKGAIDAYEDVGIVANDRVIRLGADGVESIVRGGERESHVVLTLRGEAA